MPKFYKCQECLRTVRTVSKFLCIISATSGHHQGPFKASSAPLEGIISAFSGHHQGHFRASSAPLQGIISTISGRHRTNTAWTVSVVPLQKNIRVYIMNGLGGPPVVLPNVKSVVLEVPQLPFSAISLARNFQQVSWNFHSAKICHRQNCFLSSFSLP